MEVVDLDSQLLGKLSINVIKKDGTKEPYNVEKIKNAVHKAAERVNVEITEEEMHEVCVEVLMAILEKHKAEVTVNEMHNLVELALNNFDKNVAESYRNYRNYKQDFVHMLDKVYQESQRILYLGDKSNANADSTLVTTKRSLIFNELSTQLYKKFFLSVDELQAVKEGYIYCHDIGSRLLTTNCFRRDTKFITSQGVKSFNDFKDGDEVLVPTHKGRWKKAVVHSYGEQELNKVVFKRGSRWTREVYVTENHRWLLDNGTETTKLKVGDKLLPITNISDFDWDCISDEARKYWCYGFAMADGITRYQTCKTKEDSYYTQIILCGYKVEYATYFEEAGFTVTQPKHLADKGYLSVYIPNFDKKAITFDLIPFEYIKYFINGWLSADGNRSLAKNPTSTYRSLQVTGDSNSFVYDLLNVAGYYVTSIRDITGQETNYGMRFKETKSYNIFNNQGIYKWTVDSITPTDIKETVWCLEVEEDHSFILDGGIVCGNCCIADIAAILKGGFEMSNVWYNEPKTLEVAFGVIADIVLSASGAQYGGYTIGEVDKLLEPYAKLSYDKHYKEAIELGATDEKAKEYAWKKLVRETEQGVQQWEYKYNTLSSARGDFSFISVTFGLGKSEICKMISKAFMRIRAKGQGKKGFEKPVLFPKLIFLYDEQLHGEGCELEDVFNCAVECSKIAMYPDYYSLSGNNYAGNMYKKYGTPISMMGCLKGDHSVPFKINGVPMIQGLKRTWDTLSESTIVLNQPAGEQHKYIDVKDQDIQVWDTKEQRYVKVTTFIRNVQNKWVTVKLSGGRTLEVTDNHPFETENRGVVLAKDLTLGDTIRINYSAPKLPEIHKLDASLAWLYGVMLCDGCYQNYSCFASFGKDEEDIVSNFVSSFEYNFGIIPIVKLQERGVKGSYYDVQIKKNSSVPLSKLIDLFTSKFGGVQKIFRHIPTEIWSSDRETKLNFLAGMFDADGYIKTNEGLGCLGSVNKELAFEQMYLIQALGMPCKVRKNYYKGKSVSNKSRIMVEFYPTQEFVEHLRCQKKIKNFIPDKKFKSMEEIVQVVELVSYEGEDYSYDISTESEHFEVGGVYSHNCRSALSPWFRRGGMHPADENDTPVYVGRGNMGVISLNLPMIFMKAKEENKDFYEVLYSYLELVRKLHLRTVDYLGNMKASCNPLMYTQGGFLGGSLNPDDKIAPVLKSFTTSFGITALNELQRLYNGKSIAEDGKFALEVMEYINKFVDKAKEEDHVLHAIYMTPAESLCGTQVQQFRKKYGIIKDVSDKDYFTNGFHCHVSEDLTPIEKQDLEGRFMDQAKGGQIYFNRFTCTYNTEAFKTLIRRAMKKGFYFGTNFAKSFCEDCGEESIDTDVCPNCGSENITQINRVCGYLGYSRINGDTRFNKAKLTEVKDRVSY